MQFEESNLPNDPVSLSSSMTPDRLREFEGLENTSDDEAWEIIESLRILARLLIDIEGSGKLHDSNKRFERKRKYGKR